METDDDSAVLLAGFRTWLDRERGLSPVSVRCYSKQAKYFLAAVGGPGAVSGLDAAKVTAFMVDHSRDRNTWSAKAMVTSLRAFLRFAHATGRTAVPLAGAVPAVASWRLSALPRGLPPDREPRGRAARLGLRPGAEPPACGSATSTGGPARSRSRARAAAPSGSRCRPGRGGARRLADRRPAAV